MRKSLVLLFGLVLLAGCGTTEEESKVSKQGTGEVKVMVEDADVKEERTIDFQGESPWVRNAAVRLQKLVDDGETVHLWSDAESFELWVSGLIDYVPPKTDAVNAPDPKEEIAKAHSSANDNIKVFVNELRERHPDKKEYFDTLSQVGESLIDGDTDTAKTKLSEAKTLRAN
jgi:hypothetical protein